MSDSSVQKIYSADKKVWIGMKTADANKKEEDMKIFNFADRDGDGEISKWELDRYNGPLLVENFPEKKGRIIGHAGLFRMGGLYLADNEVDYYPGLKIETVDKAGRIVYNRIDSNHDNNLSVKEMEKVTDAKAKLDETVNKLHNIENKRELLTSLGSLGTLLSCCIIGLATNTKKAGWIGTGIAVAIGTALCLANRHVAKSKAETIIDKFQKDTDNHPYAKEQMDVLKQIV